ncbi:MAG TPA: sialidase family protein [Candidatus Sulfotelmatobacter sp.]|nr:sialidase family protein [Candidatus Sulfotelmatobacter sp.]
MTSTRLQVVREVRFLSAATLLAFVLAALPGRAQTSIVRISVDNLTNSDSDHKTEVEPDTFAWGSTLVSTFHVARRPGTIGWGSGDIGYSTSTDGGKTWKYGLLPGLTVNYKNGTYGAAADPSVAYDAKHGQWLISTLPLAGLSSSSGLIGDVAVSRSTNGLNWGNPIIIDKTHLDDKNWTVCDNTTTSPYYGNCYTEWDQAYGTGDVLMSVSSDGGQTWGAGLASSDHAGGLGGEPLVQPNGTVIVPFEGGGIDVFSSANGGVSWGKSQSIATIQSHFVAAGLRNPNLPSAGIDGAGNVYVVWSDCRFRSRCASNDIVMSTSSNGTTWSAVTRIPIDPTTSTVDHFIPGIGVDPTTSGANAHLTIVYYYYPNTACNTNTCQLEVGYTTSIDGGQTWTAGAKIAGPMKINSLPVSDNGPMVADYIGVSYVNGNPFGVFPVAQPLVGATYNESMYTTKTALPVSYDVPRFSSVNDHPVPGATSDHEMKFYYDDEGHREIPSSRWIR